LWIGTEAGGLNRYDWALDRFWHYDSDSTSEIVLNHNDINAILEDHAGNLWLGTGDGLGRFDLAQKKVEYFFSNQAEKNAGEQNTINSLYEDSKHRLWVGALGDGLSLFDFERRSFKVYKNDPTDPTSISDDDVRCIYEDSHQQLWVGTYRGGLNRFDPDKGTFRLFFQILTVPKVAPFAPFTMIKKDICGWLPATDSTCSIRSHAGSTTTNTTTAILPAFHTTSFFASSRIAKAIFGLALATAA